MTHDEIITTTAENLGRERGIAAASWVFDGNTTREHYARVLQGLDDGDPEILDGLPAADLSGEWAGEPTGPDVFDEIMSDAGQPVPYDDPGPVLDAYMDRFNDVLDTYCDAFNIAAQHEVERLAREALDVDRDSTMNDADPGVDEQRDFAEEAYNADPRNFS